MLIKKYKVFSVNCINGNESSLDLIKSFRITLSCLFLYVLIYF